MMKRLLFSLLAAMLVASLVLGCGAPAPAPPAPPAPEEPAPVEPDPRAAIIEQAKQEGEVVILGSNGVDFMEKFQGFKDRYPFIEIKGLESGTSKTIGRVVKEVVAGNVTVDLFDTSEDGGFTLEREGALQKPLASFPHLKDFTPGTQPSSGLFVCTALNPRPQGVYNTTLLIPEDLPRTWDEVADPKWKGKSRQVQIWI